MPKGKVTKLKRVDKRTDSPITLVTHLSINVLALLVVDYLLVGMFLADFTSALVTAIVMGIINTYLRPILQVLALPFSIVTFGITAFLINVGLLWLVTMIVPGFMLDSFVTAAIASVLLTLTSWVLHKMAHNH